jgi:hypothetical protein
MRGRRGPGTIGAGPGFFRRDQIKPMESRQMERIRIRGLVATGGLAAFAALAMPAGAQDDAAKDTYLRYHQAIAITEKCEEREFNQAEHSNMAAYIDQQVKNQLGAGERLHLIEQAKSNAYELVTKWGCDSDKVSEFRTLFQEELLPVL